MFVMGEYLQKKKLNFICLNIKYLSCIQLNIVKRISKSLHSVFIFSIPASLELGLYVKKIYDTAAIFGPI